MKRVGSRPTYKSEELSRDIRTAAGSLLCFKSCKSLEYRTGLLFWSSSVKHTLNYMRSSLFILRSQRLRLFVNHAEGIKQGEIQLATKTAAIDIVNNTMSERNFKPPELHCCSHDRSPGRRTPNQAVKFFRRNHLTGS